MPTPIRFKGIVGTTAQIATDRFQGRIAFDTTLARFVVFFDATNYATMARRDVLETFAAGIQDSTLTAGLPMFAGTSGRHSTESVAAFRTRIGAYGSGSNAAFGTLSTTGLATLAQATVSDISQDRVVTTTTVGRLQGDTGLSVTRTSGVTKVLTLGDSGTAGASGLVINAPTGDASTVAFWAAGTSRWGLSRIATTNDFAVIARDAGATEIDRPISIVNASAGIITLGGSTLRPVNFTGAIQTSGVTRISAGGAGTLVTLSTTGLATLAQATVSDLTTGRMVSTTTAGRLQALDASGSRSLIGAYGSGDNVSLGAIEKVVSSTTESVSGNIYNQYTTVTQTGIVTQQSLAGTGAGSRTIGASRLNTQGAGMNIYLCGTYTTDASAGNATIRIRIGSTTFRTIGSFTLDSNITNGIWYIRGRITTRTTGASGTVGGQIVWEHMGSTVAGAEVMHIETATSAADVTVDLTASQTIDVDWTATDAGTSITCTCFSINLIR